MCCRRTDDHVQFLLVRTRGGRTWTFPKGHVEAGETRRAAASREAREEAGVTGEIDDAPFTRYRYPAVTDRPSFTAASDVLTTTALGSS